MQQRKGDNRSVEMIPLPGPEKELNQQWRQSYFSVKKKELDRTPALAVWQIKWPGNPPVTKHLDCTEKNLLYC